MEKQSSPNRNEALETHNSPETNRENQEFNFPGYPHYPSGQDILGSHSDAQKVETNVENFSREARTASRDAATQPLGTEERPGTAYNDLEDVLPSDNSTDANTLDSDAEITEEDFLLLGDPDEDQDGGDDEMINNQGLDDTDFDGERLNEFSDAQLASGRDLDMPDDELENSGTAMEAEDEENEYYSLGGDGKDELEEDQAGNVF
ncbi:MAG: hypothetical protein ACKVUS_15855 [Saprospiraceae bacterium]